MPLIPKTNNNPPQTPLERVIFVLQKTFEVLNYGL